MWWIIGGAGILLLAYVLTVLNSNYAVKQMLEKYFDKPCSLGLTGAEFAFAFLKLSGVENVEVQYSEKDGMNFYLPKQKIVVLEQKVCYGTSLSSIAVAGHEVAHAIQHIKGEFAWKFNFALKVFSLICSFLIIPTFIAGLVLLLFEMEIAQIILVIASAMLLMMIILKISTIFIEKSASNKAIKFLKKEGNLSSKEIKIIKELLKYASLTYVSDLFLSFFNFKRLTKI